MRSVAALVLIVGVAAKAGAQTPTVRSIALSAPNATLASDFTLATSVRELADGRLLIVDRSEKKLVVADWKNGSVIQVGRNGSGPGEYLQPSILIALGGDSTILPDSRNGRWIMLHGASIATTIGSDSPAIRSGARIPFGADLQGHVISSGAGAVSVLVSAVPRAPDSTLLVRVARASGHADTIAMLRARRATIKIQGPADNPTSVEVLINPLSAGELATLFPDGWIAIARLDPYRVDWIAPDGKRILGSPLLFERVPLDEREQRAFAEQLASRTGQPPRDPASFPAWPEIMPPFLLESILRAPDGRLWIRRPPTATNPNSRYDVVDRRGSLVGRVTSEKDVEVIGFGRAVVYTVVTDDNGIQHVQRRPFPKF